MDDADLETETPGGLLAHLLQRAERESGKTLTRPARQSFLYAEEGSPGAPTPAVQKGRFAVQEAPPHGASTPRQIELLKEN